MPEPIHNGRVTGNAKAGHSPEAVYELRAIHVDPNRRWQFQSQLPSARQWDYLRYG